jgi:hypothetical protein
VKPARHIPRSAAPIFRRKPIGKTGKSRKVY